MRYPRNLALVADSINCETSIPPRSHEHDSLLWRGGEKGEVNFELVSRGLNRPGPLTARRTAQWSSSWFATKNITRPFLWFQWFGVSFGMEVFKEFRNLVFSRMFERGGDSREEKGSWTLFRSFRPPPSSRGIDVILFHHFATMIWKEYLCGFNYGAPIKTLSLPVPFQLATCPPPSIYPSLISIPGVLVRYPGEATQRVARNDELARCLAEQGCRIKE